MKRTLALRGETLTELSATELAVVAGGQQAVPTIYECPLSGPYPTLPVADCINDVSRQTH